MKLKIFGVSYRDVVRNDRLGSLLIKFDSLRMKIDTLIIKSDSVGQIIVSDFCILNKDTFHRDILVKSVRFSVALATLLFQELGSPDSRVEWGAPFY